jgi:hypothetical protein
VLQVLEATKRKPSLLNITATVVHNLITVPKFKAKLKNLMIQNTTKNKVWVKRRIEESTAPKKEELVLFNNNSNPAWQTIVNILRIYTKVLIK